MAKVLRVLDEIPGAYDAVRVQSPCSEHGNLPWLYAFLNSADSPLEKVVLPGKVQERPFNDRIVHIHGRVDVIDLVFLGLIYDGNFWDAARNILRRVISLMADVRCSAVRSCENHNIL